jgi:hypothetical protein
MTPKQQREEISKAYVHAVAARCGYKVGTWSQDAGCIDVSIAASGILGAGIHSDPQLDLQLKATDDPRHVLRDGRVTFTLPRAHYDRLVAPRSIPKVLVVLVLPEDASLWVSHTAEQLVLRRCAWWRRMTGDPALPPENTDAFVTVHLPPSQHFSPDALQQMMTRVGLGEMP